MAKSNNHDDLDDVSLKEFLKWKKEKLGERLSDARDQVEEKLTEAKDHAESMISKNPWKTVAISAAIGALAAFTIMSINSSRRTFIDRVKEVF